MVWACGKDDEKAPVKAVVKSEKMKRGSKKKTSWFDCKKEPIHKTACFKNQLIPACRKTSWVPGR